MNEPSFQAIKFLEGINDLRDEGQLTENAHALLKDLMQEKQAKHMEFFDLLVVPDRDARDTYHINHLDDLLDAKINRELDQLYGMVCSYEEAKQASIQYRKEHELSENNNYIFGEVQFSSFLEILNKLDLPKTKGGVFVDLGSGTGRAVFLARLTQDFETCVGLEVLPSLHELAVAAKEFYQTQTQIKCQLAHAKVELVCGDLLEYDWSHATVVFVHSTCFDDELLQAMNRKAKQLKSGSYFITLVVWKDGADLVDSFDFCHEGSYPMTWGEAFVYIYRRR
jgi:SAM-dependent methyltransferase